MTHSLRLWMRTDDIQNNMKVRNKVGRKMRKGHKHLWNNKSVTEKDWRMKKTMKISAGMTRGVQKCSMWERRTTVNKNLLRLTVRIQKMQDQKMREIPGSTKEQILTTGWWRNGIFLHIYRGRHLNICKKAVSVYEGGRRVDIKGKYLNTPCTTMSN